MQKIKSVFIQSTIFLLSSSLTAGLLALSYPKFNLGFLAWIAFAPFSAGFLLLKKRSVKIILGFFTGFLFYLAILYWIYPTCTMGGLTPVFSYGAWIALCLILSLEWGIFSLFATLAPKNIAYPLFIALSWVVVEWLKVFAARKLIWFPWFMAGYTQWKYPVLIQISSVTGVYGVSFAIIFMGAGIGYLITRKSIKDAFKVFIAPLAVFLVIAVFGINRMYNYYPAPSRPLKISVLQPNVSQYKKWTPEFVNEIERNLENLAAQAAQKLPDLIIYPEAALAGYREETRWISFVNRVSAKVETRQLIGIVSQRGDKQYISAFLFDSEGDVAGYYDKQYLVPFGEYIPVKFLDKYVPVLGKLGGFNRGSTEQKNIIFDDVNIGVGICYETIFGKMWREKAAKNANILVNLTNDGWYLDTAGPYQHFIPAVFRAVENARPMIRCANTGISAYINHLGQVVKKTELGERTVLTVDAKFAKTPLPTLYTKFGDGFVNLCMILLLFLMFKRQY